MINCTNLDLTPMGNKFLRSANIIDGLLDMNREIHKDFEKLDYHMQHIQLVYRYSIIINKMLGGPSCVDKFMYISLCHDLLKEHGLKPDTEVKYNGMNIPQDPNAYVRSNLDVLKEFGLEDYFNSDAQFHSLAAGIFLKKEMHIDDPYILYPIMFHSCPIMEVYNTLPKRMQEMIDITMLSDKLSSNYLRINMYGKEVNCDLDMMVFGESGKEFNYTLGLYIARLIAKKKQHGEQSKITNTYYYSRLERWNPSIAKNIEIGRKKVWPKRPQRSEMLHLTL